jgi:hypothetical protein
MWLGTEQDIGKLYIKVKKRSSTLSKTQFNEEDKEEIIQETVVRTIHFVKRHDSQGYGELNVGRVFAMSNRFFKQALIDHAKKYDKYRESTLDDEKVIQENEKWPSIEYVQPKQEENEKGKLTTVEYKERFHLCSYKEKPTDTVQKKQAYNVVKEVIDKQLLEIVDDSVSEFIKLCLWRCNKGYTLSELAHQAEFLGNPVLERNTYITGVDFILGSYFFDLSLVLEKPKTIQINSNSIDTSDGENGQRIEMDKPIFTILPDKKTSAERSAYILEVYEILKAAFNEAIQKQKDPNMANFFYLRFWRLDAELSQEELALESGVDVKKARTYFGRFLAVINRILTEKNSSIFIDVAESGAQLNYDFTTAEVEELFNHELEN